MSTPDAALFEIDSRCKCGRCDGPGTYWMDGTCRNCRTPSRLVIEFWRGQSKRAVDCPVCGCRNAVDPTLLADYPGTPVAAGGPAGEKPR